MLAVKIILIAVFLTILYQDWKERQVHLFLFPLLGLLIGYLFFKNTLAELFYMSVLMNLLFVSMLLLTIFIYAKLKLKTSVLKTIGIGDIVLFFFLCASFSTVSFIIVLISALVFSLVIHLALNKNSNVKTVPLAGYISLFFSMTYVAFWCGIIDSLYTT